MNKDVGVKEYRDFKYCVWLVPESESEWHKYCDGWTPHMTVRSGIEKRKDAEKLMGEVVGDLKRIGSGNGLVLKMVGEIEQHNETIFYALVFNVLAVSTVLRAISWWPEGAHVSVAYRNGIGMGFRTVETAKIEAGVAVRSARVGEVRVMRCSGHYRDWKVVSRVEI